mmetsp:Transcript_32944/g.104141  ORF Transcript_32944/g.104141 Transcript_32944/m.104141 type:complete len:83 (-) Transcript_32944:239-487(-)
MRNDERRGRREGREAGWRGGGGGRGGGMWNTRGAEKVLEELVQKRTINCWGKKVKVEPEIKKQNLKVSGDSRSWLRFFVNIL